jgi:1-acyl-sn-glycerol-3-phosphate acyltransferase
MTENAPSRNQFELLRQRRFLPFFVTQFLGAFNDNILKNALVILLSFHAAEWSGLDAATLVNLCAGIFILPFFIFSATAGQIADRYEKSRLIRFVKLFEIAIMGVAAAGFAMHSLALLLTTLFLMGMHSTLFGPVKYAILPQQLAAEELVGGNALVEAGTFVAILLGTILGGVLIAEFGPPAAAGTAFTVALCGYLVSRAIPVAPAAAPHLQINWNPLTETWRNIAFSRGQRTVFLSILGISWFWFYGALFLSQFPAYAKDSLGGDEGAVTLMLALFSVGIGIGSLLCERLSGHKVEIGLVPFGAIGLTLFGADLWFATPSAASAAHLGVMSLLADARHWRIFADLTLIGIFGGFYIVPLYALVQSRSPVEHRSRIIAGNNILNAAFMVAAALIAIVLLHAGVTVPQLFLVTALLNAGVAIYIFRLVPEFLMRFLIWGLIHSVYRLDREGLENIPEEGPCIVACNHVSFVDALVIAAACRRPIRFIMDHRIFRIPLLSFVFRTGGAIPIAPAKEDPALLEQAYESVAAALAAGDVVGIFPEGQITTSGDMNPFKGGIGRIVERTPVTVVPMALSGLWGSFFSRVEGSAMTRPFRRAPFSRIRLRVGQALRPDEATPDRLQAIIAGLRGDWK